MYWDLVKLPIEHERLRWRSREVVREIEGRTGLFVRVTLTGTRFVSRALEPQVWVGETYARLVQITDDDLAVRAYFDEMPPAGPIYFGYAGRAELAFGDFDPDRISLLDRAKLPRGIVDRPQ